MFNLIIIGSGNRVIKDYLPILEYLHINKQINVVGVVNRTKKKSQILLDKFQGPYFKDLDELFIYQKKKFNVILSINPRIKDHYLNILLNKKLNVLVDTPPSNSIKFLGKISNYKKTIYFAEDFLYNPIFLRFLNKINKTKKKKFKIFNNYFIANYHFFTIIKHFIKKNVLECKIKSNLINDDNTLKEKIIYNDVAFESLSNFHSRSLNDEKELYYIDSDNTKISTKEILNELLEEFSKNNEKFYAFLNDYLSSDVDYENYQKKFKKIMKLIGLKNSIENWIVSSFSNKETFFSTRYAIDLMLLIKSSSISRKLNISIKPKNFKFLKYFL